jgi:hypothetical protein
MSGALLAEPPLENGAPGVKATVLPLDAPVCSAAKE